MRVRVSNRQLPGVTGQRTATTGAEMYREEIEADNGYIGTVVYVRRRRKAPAGSASSTGFASEYGWRPEKSHPNSRLTGKVEAIKRLPRCP